MPNSEQSISEKRGKRTAFMAQLYELTDGSKMARVNMREIGGNFGWTDQETFEIAKYLADQGLLEFAAFGGLIAITHQGVIEVEDLLQSPEHTTPHFEPVSSVNVTIQGDNFGPIQAAGRDARQHNAGKRATELQLFLNELRTALEANPQGPTYVIAKANVHLVEAEIIEGRADSPLIRALLPGLRDLAIGIASSGTYAALLAAANQLHF